MGEVNHCRKKKIRKKRMKTKMMLAIADYLPVMAWGEALSEGLCIFGQVEDLSHHFPNPSAPPSLSGHAKSLNGPKRLQNQHLAPISSPMVMP